MPPIENSAPPKHTPYDGAHPLFQIGLKPLDLADWIEVDGRLLPYLDEKDRLWQRHPHDVVASEPGTEDAQAEVLHLLADHLPERYPDIYQRLGPQIDIIPAFRRVRMDDLAPPLLIAANLVQDDLVLMRKGEAGWRLAAAALCFPSSWKLSDKFGKPMHQIHGPVPGFGEGTRNDGLITRMFDNLQVPVVRWNWSIYGDDALYHPLPGPPEGRFTDGVYMRVERQTLRKLPQSGDILFAIRIHVDPLEALDSHPEGAAIAGGLIAQIEAFTPEQLDYKGLTHDRAALIARLAKTATA